jgi:hypothetical protein
MMEGGGDEVFFQAQAPEDEKNPVLLRTGSILTTFLLKCKHVASGRAYFSHPEFNYPGV